MCECIYCLGLLFRLSSIIWLIIGIKLEAVSLANFWNWQLQYRKDVFQYQRVFCCITFCSMSVILLFFFGYFLFLPCVVIQYLVVFCRIKNKILFMYLCSLYCSSVFHKRHIFLILNSVSWLRSKTMVKILSLIFFLLWGHIHAFPIYFRC